MQFFEKSHLGYGLSLKLKYNKKTKGCEGKIAALLQAKGLSVGLCGIANVLQFAWAVVFPNATEGRKERGGKKLKSHAVNLEFAEIFSVIRFGLFQGCTSVSTRRNGLHLTDGGMVSCRFRSTFLSSYNYF